MHRFYRTAVALVLAAVTVAGCTPSDTSAPPLPTDVPVPSASAGDLLINGVSALEMLNAANKALGTTFAIKVVGPIEKVPCKPNKVVGTDTTGVRYCVAEGYFAVPAGLQNAAAWSQKAPVVLWYDFGWAASLAATNENPDVNYCMGAYIAATMPGFGEQDLSALRTYLNPVNLAKNWTSPQAVAAAEKGVAAARDGKPISACK